MARPIFETLRDIRAGALLDEAASALAEVVLAVQQTGKAGELSIKLKVKPAARGSSRTLVVDDEVVKKVPEADREVSVFFPTADGSLTKSDPAQIPLGLRLADAPPSPAGSRVDTSTGEILAS